MPITDYSSPIDRKNTPLMWGEVADLGNAIIWKYENAEPGVLLFGFGVVQGTTDSAAIYPVDNTSKFIGIVYSTDTYEKRVGYSVDANGRFGYPPKGTTFGVDLTNPMSSVIRKADRVAVPIDSNVAAGDPVFLRSGGGTKGVFRNAADGTNTIAIPRARWLFAGTGSAGTIGTGYLVLEGVL